MNGLPVVLLLPGGVFSGPAAAHHRIGAAAMKWTRYSPLAILCLPSRRCRCTQPAGRLLPRVAFIGFSRWSMYYGMSDPIDVVIDGAAIRLGQFLKLANLIESGAEAKTVLAAGLIRVNDEVELRRGRQLQIGDVVALAGHRARVAAD